MKKLVLISILFWTNNVQAQQQPIDTTVIRNLSGKTFEWLYHIALLEGNKSDSSNIIIAKRLVKKLFAANPANLTADVVIDSLPGKLVLYFYQNELSKPNGQREYMGNNFKNKMDVLTHPIFVTLRAVYDATHKSDVDRIINKGKNIALDQ